MSTDLDSLEAQIRAEADRKLDAARTLTRARRTLLDARDAFAKTDADNLAAFRTALSAARTAGLADKLLADLDIDTAPRKPRNRKRPTAGAAHRAHAPTPAATTAPEPGGTAREPDAG